MKMNIYTVYDDAAKAYLTPFFLQNDSMSKRIFKDCSNDENHAFGRNPADYTLFHIGEFNDTTAEITYLSPYNNLGNAVEYVNIDADEIEIPQPTPIKEVNSNAKT